MISSPSSSPAGAGDAFQKLGAKSSLVPKQELIYYHLFNKILISSLNYVWFSNVLSMFAIVLLLLAGKKPGKEKLRKNSNNWAQNKTKILFKEKVIRGKAESTLNLNLSCKSKMSRNGCLTAT